VNLIVIQASDEELENMTLAEIVSRSAQSSEKKLSEREEPYQVKEAAKALNLSVPSIYARVQAGTIRKVPGVGRVLIPAAEVQRLTA
jgi:excisionase family DNA binding protein